MYFDDGGRSFVGNSNWKSLDNAGHKSIWDLGFDLDDMFSGKSFCKNRRMMQNLVCKNYVKTNTYFITQRLSSLHMVNLKLTPLWCEPSLLSVIATSPFCHNRVRCKSREAPFCFSRDAAPGAGSTGSGAAPSLFLLWGWTDVAAVVPPGALPSPGAPGVRAKTAGSRQLPRCYGFAGLRLQKSAETWTLLTVFFVQVVCWRRIRSDREVFSVISFVYCLIIPGKSFRCTYFISQTVPIV